jgi:predicted lipoprotein
MHRTVQSKGNAATQPREVVAGRGALATARAAYGHAARATLIAAFALSSGGCRKPPPDEVVYTGRASAPNPPVPPAGIGSTGGTGGSTGSGGRGATGGAGGNTDGGSGGTGADPTAPFSKAALLVAIADCAMDRYREFEELAVKLDQKARDAASSTGAPDFAELRQAWLSAIDKWQEVELFRFGPMARSVDPGGQDLRDQIYGWPLVSRCGIEERMVSHGYGGADIAAALINVRGLGALEYTAFYAGTDNACSPFSTINAHGSWAALDATEIARRRAEYGAAVSANVVLHAKSVVERWSPSGGNFRAELTLAGQQSATYASEQKALNAVSDAMFYIEMEAKDWKLGRPLGLGDCTTPTCPEALESPYALQSTSHLWHNLAGFRLLFQGCGAGNGGFGFDDWLRAVGASDLADRMLAALAGAEEAVDRLDPPLEQAIATDPARAMSVYAAFKVLTYMLKTEFVTVLNLEPPKPVQGDND